MPLHETIYAVSTVTLNNGVRMPLLGFGVFRIADLADASGLSPMRSAEVTRSQRMDK